MILAMSFFSSLQRASRRRAISNSEKQLQATIERLHREKEDDKAQIARLREDLETAQVKLRLAQIEIEKLAAICRRDLERVRSEGDSYAKQRDPTQ